MRPLSFKALWKEEGSRDRPLDTRNHKRKYKKKARQKAKKEIRSAR